MADGKNTPRIRIIKNGPYNVTGGVPLSAESVVCDEAGYPTGYKKIRTYPLQEHYILCRCGKSKNPPFCDGSHLAANFNGTETARKTRHYKKYNGPTLFLRDEEELCAGMGFCDVAPGTWDMTDNSDDPEMRRHGIETANLCPSGRLIMEDSETGDDLQRKYEPGIVILEEPAEGVSGPVAVRGGIVLESCEGDEYQVCEKMTLCRCGRSENKPFCDGTHRPAGYKVQYK